MKQPTRKGKEIVAELELRGNRLILIQRFGHMKSSKIEVDVTGVWHFFKDYQAYLSSPRGLEQVQNG